MCGSVTLEDPDIQAIQEQARYWLVRRHSGEISPNERRDFEDWLDRDPRHHDAYARAAGLWQNLDEFKSGALPARDAARAYRPRTQTSRFRHFQLAASLGLVLVIGLAAGNRLWFEPSAEFHQTARGEQKSIALADGSQLNLNTDSAVRIEYTRSGRVIRLEQGEALFTVNHGDERPFDVLAGAGRIRDIGTIFNVYKQPGGAVVVSVKEGAVSVTTDRITPLHLSQGDRLAYAADGLRTGFDRIDPASADAWRDGRITFTRSTLGEVATQMARYHAVVFSFESPELKQLKLSGTFGTGDLSLFLRTLSATLPVEARLEGRVVHLASSPLPPSAP